MTKITFYLLVFCVAGFQEMVFGAKFPDDEIKRCRYGDTACLQDVITYVLKNKNQGLSSINLLKLDPLHVPKIDIIQKTTSPVNIELYLKETDIYGVNNFVINKVSGFGKEIAGKYEIKGISPIVTLIGDHEISGQLLIIPGKGAFNFTFLGYEATIRFNGVPVEKNGKTYLKMENFKFHFDVSRAITKFDNLFNGNKALSDSTNDLINENWRDIFNELSESLNKAATKIFEQVMANVFEKIPYAEMFLEEVFR